MFLCPKNEKQDTMRWASIETEISSKVEEKETAPIGSQSVYGREVGKFNKRKDHKSKSNAQTFHSCKSHTSHSIHTLHQIYVFLSETGMQNEKGLVPDKSFRKTFGEKEDNSNKSKFQGISNPNQNVGQVKSRKIRTDQVLCNQHPRRTK